MDPVVALRRATRWFWALTAVAILLVGALSEELTSDPSPTVGTAVALTGLVLVLVVTQVCRLMLAIGRAAPPRRRRPTGPRFTPLAGPTARVRRGRANRRSSGRASTVASEGPIQEHAPDR